MDNLKQIKESLFEIKLQSITNEIICNALENKYYIITDQIETKLDNFQMNVDTICESKSERDTFGRIKIEFNLFSILTGEYISKSEIYFDKNGVYNEASFELVNNEYVDTNLINQLQLHKLEIAKNLFKYPKS